MSKATADDFHGLGTPRHTLAMVPGEKVLSVSVIIDREEPYGIVTYSVHQEGR